MIDKFPQFSKAINARYAELAASELYIVEVEDLFSTYLAAFPEGTNPIFRERTEHDCSCCKQFIRTLGRVVALKDGEVQTVWDVEGLPHPYDVVAKALADTVRQAPIKDVFRTKEGKYGLDHNYDDDGTRWNHFVGEVGRPHRCPNPDTVRGGVRAIVDVMRRGLTEIKPTALADIIDLIDSNSIYRGAEHANAVRAFAELQQKFLAAANKDTFVWENQRHPAGRFRNTVIGTLAVDLSEGVDLERAVKSFESKVAPTNYKRPKALITPKMIENAVNKLKDLGLEEAIERRMARLSDISVNNVLFVNNATKGKMKDGLTEKLLAAAKPKAVSVENATPIKLQDFLDNVLPKASTVDLALSNDHLDHFVSLTAPVHESTGRLFKWDNDFAWSYDGEVTDSIKQRVKAAGGNVNALLRVSLSWSNFDDLDIHAVTPDGEIAYFSKRGILDVDMNAGGPRSRTPVENLAWNSLTDGDYRVFVEQFSQREDKDFGFTIEIEYGGKTTQFSYDKMMRTRDRVDCVTFTVERGLVTNMKMAGKDLVLGSVPMEKWGVKTEQLVPVNVLMLSPNHWDGQEVGNRHVFFCLEGCKNPLEVRGIYNEFLRGDLDEHRKVFEVVGSKTKCPPTDDQLSGVGFSAARGDKAVVVVKGDTINRAYEIEF